MIKRALLFVAVLTGLVWTGLGFTDFESASTEAPGDLPAAATVGELELDGLEGDTVRFADLRGKVVLVDFWATWCPPCRAMIPSLNRLQAKYADKGLVIVGISMDQGGAEDVHAFRKRQPLDYTIALGTMETVAAFGSVEALPTSFLVDRQGKIRSSHVGFTSEATLEAEIAKLLAEK